MYKKRLQAFKVLEVSKNLFFFFAFKIRAFSLKKCPGHRAAKTSRDMPVT